MPHPSEYYWLRKATQIEWRLGPVGNRKSRPIPPCHVVTFKKGEFTAMSLIMTVVQECPLEVRFKDSMGNEAPVENIQWSSSDEGIVKVRIDDPGAPNKAVAVSAAVGTAQVNVRADARVGEGTSDITGLLAVEILAAEATVVEISAGTPVDQTTAPTKKGPAKK